MDEVQFCVARWHEHGDQRAFGRALRVLETEWRGRVADFTRGAPDAVEEVLQELIVRAVVTENGARPKLLAPDDVESPRAWRLTVLRRMLVDRHRAEGRARARDERLGAAVDGDLPHAGPVPRAALDPLEGVLAEQRRDAVRAAMASLRSARRRVAIGMSLGFDMTADLDALAAELGVPADNLRARMGEASQAAALRLLYPDASAVDADTFRKLLKRAQEDLAAALRAAAA
jgi:DNA-directed RNA polymerase specialized sigma24 family protein